ncbi:MAG: hypothetical protein ACI822_000971 [Gammaproteobacteria bacterium]|jgi:hypothetical protein
MLFKSISKTVKTGIALTIVFILIVGFMLSSDNATNGWTSDDLAEGEFIFFVLGDTSYKAPDDYPAYRGLIHSINRAKPAFTIHVGDTKPGHGTCKMVWQLEVWSFFNLFEGPLIYTPGDNDWTDCGRSRTREDPIASLGYIREVFYPDTHSLGNNPLKLTRQPDIQMHSQTVENSAWRYEGVQFGTIHLVGVNNNLRPHNAAAMAEYQVRNPANLSWIEHLFDRARASDTRALVIAFHAEILRRNPLGTGFEDTVLALKREALNFNKPILIVHGDTHSYVVDYLFENEKKWQIPDGRFNHVKRVETFGPPYQKAVQVTVTPMSAGVDEVFKIRPYDPPWGGCTFIYLCAFLGLE